MFLRTTFASKYAVLNYPHGNKQIDTTNRRIGLKITLAVYQLIQYLCMREAMKILWGLEWDEQAIKHDRLLSLFCC